MYDIIKVPKWATVTNLFNRFDINREQISSVDLVYTALGLDQLCLIKDTWSDMSRDLTCHVVLAFTWRVNIRWSLDNGAFSEDLKCYFLTYRSKVIRLVCVCRYKDIMRTVSVPQSRKLTCMISEISLTHNASFSRRRRTNHHYLRNWQKLGLLLC